MSRSIESPVAKCISHIKSELPVVARALDVCGELTLRDYLAQMNTGRVEAYQGHSDLVTIMVRNTCKLLGEDTSIHLQRDLAAQPAVLTANHHGLDTFAQSVQTNLIFSLRERPDGTPAATVPVLACSNVPINNLTYPRGLLIYGSKQSFSKPGPLKLPLFPDRYKRKMVNQIEGFSKEMLVRLKGKVTELRDKAILDEVNASTLNQILDRDFSHVLARKLASYSDQATVLNNRIWKTIYRDSTKKPELIYLDMERIVSELLITDLRNKDSLVYQLMFDTTMRNSLLEILNGERACWNRDSLETALREPGSHVDNGAGTIFFWGMDGAGKRIPLTIVESANGRVKLCGVTDSGATWETGFRPCDIIDAIENGRLQPSLFICYLVVSIARGIACLGGYYQAGYLPVMQNGVATALQQSTFPPGLTALVSTAVTDLYLSGMQAVALDTSGRMQAAGIIEIGSRGGLTDEMLEEIANTTVYDAHIASIADTLNDIDRSWLADKEEKEAITDAVGEYVADRIVMIDANPVS